MNPESEQDDEICLSYYHIIVIIIIMIVVRGATRHQIRSFLNIVQKGGGSFPCSKILEQILYDFKGILAT